MITRTMKGAALLAALCTWMTAAPLRAAEDRPYPRMTVLQEGGKEGLLLPLKLTRVRAQVTDGEAVTDLTQVYKNDTGKKIEALYQFPLPAEGAVTDMVVTINERSLFGTVKEREQARKELEAARQAGQTASLVEQERPNFFTQTITNIQPGDELSVTLRVQHPLRYSAGAFEYDFPLTQGPRYMGLGTTDAHKVSPPYVPEGVDGGRRVDLELRLRSSAPVSELGSSSHKVVISEEGGAKVLRLDPSDRIPNKDFILRYKAAGERPQFSLQAHRLPGEDGYFSLTVLPPAKLAKGVVVPKELVFVVDHSGSMSGPPMEKAKQALEASLKKLGPQDTFNVVIFDDGVARLFDAPKRADAANLKLAVDYARAIQPAGGTEMEKPMREALGYPKDPQRQRIVLFITDGNVGNEQHLVSVVRKELGQSRVFSVGIGSAVNRYLMGEFAREGKGAAEYIRQDEDVAQRLGAIYAKISNPVLTGISVDFGGAEVSGIYPEKQRDLFSEEPLVLTGRYKTGGRFKVTVKGRAGAGPAVLSQEIELPSQGAENPALRYAWARRKIEALSLSALGEETEALKKAIIEVSTKHSVLSRYTAFIAVERQRRGDLAPAQTWVIPSELPEGLRYAGFGPEIQLKVDRVRPGDPELYVDAPKDARVAARLPFGELLELQYDAAIKKHSARFLVPFGTPDGAYPFDVLVTDAKGNTRTLRAQYVVDSKGPDLTFYARLKRGKLVLEAVPERDVFIGEGAEVWPDVKLVKVQLPGGQVLELKLQPSRKSRFIWRWEGTPALPLKVGEKLRTQAVDYAGNWRDGHVSVVLP